MKHFVYIISWTLLFASASAGAKFATGESGKFDGPVFWKKTETFKVVRFVVVMQALNTFALIAWGLLNLIWYVAILEFIAALVIASAVQERLNPLARIYFGWIIILWAVLWLWTRTS